MNVSSIHKRDISRRLISSPLPPVSSEGTREPPRVYPPFRTHSWYISIAARFLRRGFQGPPVALPLNGSHGKRRSRLVRTKFFPLPTEPFPRVSDTCAHCTPSISSLCSPRPPPRPLLSAALEIWNFLRTRTTRVRACVADAYLRCTYVARRARCNTKISGGSVEATRRKVKLSSHVSR